QRLSTNQRTAEREERFVDVGPLVVADTEASKLIEPGKCPLDDPAPSSQTAAVLGAAHRRQRQDAASSQPGSDCLCIVAAVSHHTIWATPRPSPLALEWQNRIHQRQCLLRVVSVGAGQANRERHAPPVADQMALAPALAPTRGIWTGLAPAVDGADGTTVHDRPRPINLAGARVPVQQRKVHQIPNAGPLPIAQAPPARHPPPAPEFLRAHLPRNAAPKDEDDARQARAIRNAWSATLWPSWKNRQEGFDKIPQPIWKQRRGRTPFTLLRRRGQGSGGFVTRSKPQCPDPMSPCPHVPMSPCPHVPNLP